MAKVLADFVFPARTWGGLKMEAKYPWDQWLNGDTWCLTQGEDFDLAPAGFRAQVSTMAMKKGLKVRLHAIGPDVYIKRIGVYTPDEIKELAAKRLAKREAHQLNLASKK